MAGEVGARVVLAARDRDALESAAGVVVRAGGEAEVVVCDVSDEVAVARIGRVARDAFGGVDTWVNNAGTSIYGTLEEVTVEDLRRLMDVNFWGTVYGSRVAVPLLEAGGGGALVNVGSVLSERTIPLQAMYCATKHAVKAFTDGLRMELAHRGAPVAVSLVKPASIDTPFYDVARNYMPRRPRPVPPLYAPEVPARAILACATRPTRELYAGGAAVALGASEELAPGLTDRVMEGLFFDAQQSDEAPAGARGNLDAPVDAAAERGRYDGPVFAHSAYTSVAARAPRGGAGVLLAAGLGALAVLGLTAGARRGSRNAPRAGD
ncbi:hypothetical protein tb265_30980 [Gemmatimonadetes bacterium T265]|nr:hypothetical protein tb265_30980 [Gemmatimonadetes bacterium T265]